MAQSLQKLLFRPKNHQLWRIFATLKYNFFTFFFLSTYSSWPIFSRKILVQTEKLMLVPFMKLQKQQNSEIWCFFLFSMYKKSLKHFIKDTPEISWNEYETLLKLVSSYPREFVNQRHSQDFKGGGHFVACFLS